MAAAKSEAEEDKDGKEPMPKILVEGIIFKGGGAARAVAFREDSGTGAMERTVEVIDIGLQRGKDRSDGSL